MRACTNWGTDIRRRAAGPLPRAIGRRPSIVGLSLIAMLAAGLPARPARAGDADLDRLLEKAIQAVDKAADAARGRDAGRVSLLLIKADEQIESFATASGIAPLAAALDAAGAATARGEYAAATTEIRAARSRIARINGYIVPRRAEETGRAALIAADAGDAAGLGTAIEGLRAALRVDVLQGRLHDARSAIARARETMVRNDMAAGRTAIADAQAGLAGFRYAAGLSRATYNLAASADLLQAEALLGARDLVRRAARDLRLAVDAAPAAQRQPVEEAYRTADGLWKRMNRPRDVDPAALRDAAARVEAIRQEQDA